MAQIYFLLPTADGEAKLANAQALGVPLKFTAMSVGDGNGALPIPSRDRKTLINERRRAAINSLTQDPQNQSQFIAEQVIPETEGGWWIREAGIHSEDGTLCYYANIPETYKPVLAEGSARNQVIRLVCLNTSGATVELKVDPSIVLATRQYVDTKISDELDKRDAKQSVLVATTGPLAALTGLQTVDGVVLVAGARVLVKDQAAGKDNGIYVAAAGAWTRATDADAAIEVTPGMLVPVEQGDKNADSLWQLATDGTIVLGTTPIAFEMAAGRTGVTAGTYRSVTVSARGQVTGGTNPTTLAGFGITDGVTYFTTGQALPTSNIGPIWHDDYNSFMTWQTFNANGANYTGYASLLVGSLLADTQPTPRAGYVKSGVTNLSRTVYAALRGWAMHNGIMVASATWAAGAIAMKDNADGTTFTVFDVRAQFPRFLDDGRGVDTSRIFGSNQLDELKAHGHTWSTIFGSNYDYGQYTNNAMQSALGGVSGLLIAGTVGTTGGTETRPRNTALLPTIKI